MNRINTLFSKKKNILSIYFTAGFPNLNDTERIILELEKAEVDLIEIGIPYSDPLADGPTIQESSSSALKKGMTLKLLFEQLKTIREKTQIPLILMGYLNPIIQFGVERFCEKCTDIGIDGLILPDLPLDVYKKEYKSLFEQHNLKNIFLITPQTSKERILKIDEASSAFIYMVSSSSTTGKSLNTNNQTAYFERVNEMKLNNPTIIGFGINDNNTFKAACQHSHGAIIGSEFIRALKNGISVDKFIAKIKG